MKRMMLTNRKWLIILLGLAVFILLAGPEGVPLAVLLGLGILGYLGFRHRNKVRTLLNSRVMIGGKLLRSPKGTAYPGQRPRKNLQDLLSHRITITAKQLVLFLAFLGFLFLLAASVFNTELVEVLGVPMLIIVLGIPSLVLWAAAEFLARSPDHRRPATEGHQLRTLLVFHPGVLVVAISP